MQQSGANLGAYWARTEHSLRERHKQPLLRPNLPPYRIRSGTAPHAVTFRDRVGRLRQFLIASGQIQMAASARIRRKIEQPEKSGMLT